MKVLLVDDDVFLRDMYAMKFTQRGDSVTGVGTGEEALRLIGSEAFDAVTLDMVMPGMTGIDLLKAIKGLELPHMPKCIILSNQGEDTDREKAFAEGAAGYIIKADSVPSEVVEEVHKIVS
jgi:CheY-like chemotaxis protein